MLTFVKDFFIITWILYQPKLEESYLLVILYLLARWLIFYFIENNQILRITAFIKEIPDKW